MTTDHQAELEALMAYHDGELSTIEADRLRTHVAGCAECQKVEADMRALSNRLQTWEVGGAPSTLLAPAPLQRTGAMRKSMSVAAALLITAAAGIVWLASRGGSGELDIVHNWESSSPRAVPEALDAAVTPPPARPAQRPQMMIAVGEAPLLARTARLTIVTDRFDAGRVEMDALIRKLEGFTSRILVTGTAEQGRALTATLRIPSARLDEAVAGLKALGRVSSEGVDGEDVTQQSIDLDARLANARNSEKRLTDVLANRTGDLDDVLAVEREIARVRGEIESMEAQRKALDRRVTYATIDLQLTEEKRAAVDLGPQPLSTRFVDEFVRGWNGVLGAGVDLGLLLARLTPLILSLLVFSAPLIALRRRRRARAD
jgi:hypothetical protein